MTHTFEVAYWTTVAVGAGICTVAGSVMLLVSAGWLLQRWRGR